MTTKLKWGSQWSDHYTQVGVLVVGPLVEELFFVASLIQSISILHNTFKLIECQTLTKNKYSLYLRVFSPSVST